MLKHEFIDCIESMVIESIIFDFGTSYNTLGVVSCNIVELIKIIFERIFKENSQIQTRKELTFEINKISIIGESEIQTRRDATLAVKNLFAILGYWLGYKVYSNDVGEIEESDKNYGFTNHEWLFDSIWYLDTPLKKYEIKTLFLAMECEWGKQRANERVKKESIEQKDVFGEVKYDFQKLIVCSACISVLVFIRIKNSKVMGELYEYFQETIDNYTNPPKEQLFIFITLNEKFRNPEFKTLVRKQ